MARKKFLVLGGSGFIGTYLVEHLTSLGHAVVGTYHSHVQPGLKHCDLLDFDEIATLVSHVQPDIVLFLSGSKDVNRCEQDPSYAIELNVQTVRNFLDACKRIDLRPLCVFFSTDYVFDGVRGHYGRNDAIGPRTVYGMTNLLAERLFLASGLPGVLLRVSAVMGQKGGFFHWLKQSLEREETISLFANTYFSPTSIGRLCRFIVDVSDQMNLEKMTISHLSDGYRMSRYEFGRTIAAHLCKPQSLILPVTVDLNSSTFQPDLSLLPDGQDDFFAVDRWNELEKIW